MRARPDLFSGHNVRLLHRGWWALLTGCQRGEQTIPNFGISASFTKCHLCSGSKPGAESCLLFLCSFLVFFLHLFLFFTIPGSTRAMLVAATWGSNEANQKAGGEMNYGQERCVCVCVSMCVCVISVGKSRQGRVNNLQIG